MSVVPSGPYVYALVDPRDSAVFYIGKGKGRRMYEHEREAARGDKYVTNPEKRARIDAILSAGLRVTHRVIEQYGSEADAFNAESELIASLPGLTNRNRGRKGTSSRELSPEAKLASAVQTLTAAFSDTLAWKPATPEGQQARARHIATINRAMALMGRLAAELAAPAKH